MKTYYLLIILLVLVAPKTFAQTSIPLSRVSILKTGDNSKGVTFGQSPQQLIAILGQPTKIEDNFNEMENVTEKVYIYGKSKFYFIGNKLDSFDINDSSISVGTIGGASSKVGDKLTITTKQIPSDPRNPGRTTTVTTKSFLDLPLDTKKAIDRNMVYASRSSVSINNSDYFINFLFNDQDILFNIAIHSN